MATTEPDPLANPDTADRVAAAFGVCAVVVSLGGIALAILLSTRFSFAADALSDLGRATWDSSAVFNTGLLVSGLCALVPGVVLARNSRTLLHAAGSVAFSLSAVCLALIGVFALPAPQHGTVAVGFFLLFTVAFVCYGAGDLRTEARRWGLFAIALAAVHVAAWAVWIAAGTPGGLALPELVGSGCVSTWILGTAVRMW
ncbi:DUF998 domain-containing protein [Halococcus sp. IIIV-5B]|uniref:DUF998 domain-containing protein n=1 Tax=Halococcus sp. IIIV-5B TaxID=2321230 RepID=UPI000E767EAD|nr:DUF998 domain-containing protein [Halococcus sp. IIIV-5B]RJT06579.1 DUF998 domain-containing protein [Halococcus sp. IIIV-5B]